jgi:hypothetical protein
MTKKYLKPEILKTGDVQSVGIQSRKQKKISTPIAHDLST